MTQGVQQSARLRDQPGGDAPRGRLVEAGGLPGAGLPHGGPARSTQSAATERTSPVPRGGSPPPGRPASAAPSTDHVVAYAPVAEADRAESAGRFGSTVPRPTSSATSCPSRPASSRPRAASARRASTAGRSSGVTGSEAVGERRMHGLTCGPAGLRRLRQHRRAAPLFAGGAVRQVAGAAVPGAGVPAPVAGGRSTPVSDCRRG
jgi:hypothetical protein